MAASDWRPGWKTYAAIWLAMMALRQDFWFWSDRTLVAGVLPIGLAYQGGYSVLASLVLYALVRWSWPHELEREEEPGPGPERR